MVRPLIRLVRDDRGPAQLGIRFRRGGAAARFRRRRAARRVRPRGRHADLRGPPGRRDRAARFGQPWRSTGRACGSRSPSRASASGAASRSRFTASADAPFAFMNGKPTPLEARHRSRRRSRVIFTRRGGRYPSAAADRRPEALDALAAPLCRPGSAARSAPARRSAPPASSARRLSRERVLSVENAELTLDGNCASGALEDDGASPPRHHRHACLSLARPHPLFRRALHGAPHRPRLARVSLSTRTGSHDLTADIRLSANSVQARRAWLRQCRGERFAARVRGWRSASPRPPSTAAASRATLSSPIAPDGRGRRLRCAAARDRFDLAKAALPLGLPPGVSGTASVATDLAGRGRRFGEIVGGLAGTSTIEVANGALPLFGIAELRDARVRPHPAARGHAGDRADRRAFPSPKASRRWSALNVAAPYFSADASGRIGLLDGAARSDRHGHAGCPRRRRRSLFAVGGTPGAQPLAAARSPIRSRGSMRAGARLGRRAAAARTRRTPRCRSGWWRWR